jgi:hypothetical protein
LQPAAATAHGSVNVEIMVNDTLHPVTDPTAVSAHIFKPGDVTLTQEMGAVPLRMQGTILFSTFTPPLAGTQIITATATNPKGTVGTATKQFIVDNDGPVISFVNPVPGQFIGGVVEIKADITDISGVNESSVLAVFGNDPTHNSVPLVRVDPMSNVFHGFFDVRSLGQHYVLPELSVSANDLLGNSSQLSEEIIVDNTPPRMTMDSQLQMFLSQLNQATGQIECSQPFSPLGPFLSSPPEAAYNGAVMAQAIGLRARIEDEGNNAPGLLATHLSGIDDTSVYLFAIHDDQNTPLAVDTDGDGVCDDVNPQLVPSSSAMGPGVALSIKMEPMSSGGNADFRVPGSTAGYPTPVGTCQAYGDGAVSKPPSILCTQAGTHMTVVIPWFDKGIAGPIFTIPPVAAMTGECVGLQLDAQNTLPNGPTCVVAVATDKAGNTMVSPVLHVCIDKSGNTANGSPDMGGTPCAGWPLTSTPPTPASPPTGYQATCTGVWDKVNMKITTGTCKPGPTFANGNVRDLDDFK